MLLHVRWRPAGGCGRVGWGAEQAEKIPDGGGPGGRFGPGAGEGDRGSVAGLDLPVGGLPGDDEPEPVSAVAGDVDGVGAGLLVPGDRAGVRQSRPGRALAVFL